MTKRTYHGAVFNAGERVQIGAHTDTWMRGDRYGEVVRITQGGATVHVRMDQSGRVIKMHASNWTHVQ